MRALKVSTLGLAVALLGACSSGTDQHDARRADPTSAAAADSSSHKSVFDPVTRTPLDRARGVQGTIDASAERTRTSAERQERGDD